MSDQNNQSMAYIAGMTETIFKILQNIQYQNIGIEKRLGELEQKVPMTHTMPLNETNSEAKLNALLTTQEIAAKKINQLIKEVRSLKETDSEMSEKLSGLIRCSAHGSIKVHQELVTLNAASESSRAKISSEIKSQTRSWKNNQYNIKEQLTGELTDVKGELSEVKGELSDVKGELVGEILGLRDIALNIKELTEHQTYELSDVKDIAGDNSTELSNLKDIAGNNSAELSNLKDIAGNNSDELSNLKDSAEGHVEEFSNLKKVAESQTAELSNLKKIAEFQTSELAVVKVIAKSQTNDLYDVKSIVEYQVVEVSIVKDIAVRQSIDLSSVKNIAEKQTAALSRVKDITDDHTFSLSSLKDIAERQTVKLASVKNSSKRLMSELSTMNETARQQADELAGAREVAERHIVDLASVKSIAERQTVELSSVKDMAEHQMVQLSKVRDACERQQRDMVVMKGELTGDLQDLKKLNAKPLYRKRADFSSRGDWADYARYFKAHARVGMSVRYCEEESYCGVNKGDVGTVTEFDNLYVSVDWAQKNYNTSVHFKYIELIG